MSETSIWGGDNPSVAWNQNSFQSNLLTVELTGVSATTSLGSSKEFNETGWGRLAWNDADWGEGADETISVSGFELTSSTGSINTEVKYLLEMIGSNHSLTSSVGSVDADGEIGVPLTGVQSDFATPTLSYTGTLIGWGRDAWGDNSWGESPNQIVDLVGREATSSVGSSTLEFAYELSSQVATTSIGSPTVILSPTISADGQSSTISQGTVGLEFGPASISGVSSTSSVGSLGLEFGPAEITGLSSTTSVGTLEIGSVELLNLTGVSSTSSVGSLTTKIGVPLTGVSSTFSVGSFTLADITQGLSTDSITSSIGLLGIQSYGNVDTGSNTSYSNISTGSNDTYSDVATGSNTSYTDAA
jgi:hypothetical protein